MSGYSWFKILEISKYPPIIDEYTQYRLKKYSGTVSFYLVACRHSTIYLSKRWRWFVNEGDLVTIFFRVTSATSSSYTNVSAVICFD